MCGSKRMNARAPTPTDASTHHVASAEPARHPPCTHPPTSTHPPPTPAQEIVAAVGRSSGIVLMSPPRDNADARTSLAAVSSAIKAKTKVRRVRACAWSGRACG